jgi:endonuclease III
VLKVCRRLPLLPDGHDAASLTHLIENMVPKQGMFEFHWLLSEHAKNTCLPEAPACAECELRSDCRTGRNAVAQAESARKGKKVSRK